MMIADRRLLWLRRVLFVKVLLTLFAWGLPALLVPLSLLAILRVPIPENPIYLRLFGGACTAFGVAYWFAYRDPVRNVAIVKAGLADNRLLCEWESWDEEAIRAALGVALFPVEAIHLAGE